MRLSNYSNALGQDLLTLLHYKLRKICPSLAFPLFFSTPLLITQALSRTNMSNTYKISVKYYNKDMPDDYEYTVNDTIHSFLERHSNIGDAPISHIFVGMFTYPGNCQLSILNVVNNMVQGEPIVAFPSAVSLPITHISSTGRPKHMLIDFQPLAKLNKLKDELCNIFNIPAYTEYKFYSDVETELPYNLYQFNFEATMFYIVENPQK